MYRNTFFLIHTYQQVVLWSILSLFHGCNSTLSPCYPHIQKRYTQYLWRSSDESVVLCTSTVFNNTSLSKRPHKKGKGCCDPSSLVIQPFPNHIYITLYFFIIIYQLCYLLACMHCSCVIAPAHFLANIRV